MVDVVVPVDVRLVDAELVVIRQVVPPVVMPVVMPAWVPEVMLVATLVVMLAAPRAVKRVARRTSSSSRVCLTRLSPSRVVTSSRTPFILPA